MKQKQITLVIVTTLFSLVIFGCKSKASQKSRKNVKEQSAPISTMRLSAQKEKIFREKKEVPKYIYKSHRRRDPFIPLVGKVEALFSSETISSASSGKVNISKLIMKGLIWDKASPFVLLKSDDGNTYVAGEQGLVDDRGIMVQGVASIIKEEKLVLISENNVIKEFKFSKLREESE